MRNIAEDVLSDADRLIALSLSAPTPELKYDEPNFLIEGYDDYTNIRIPRTRNQPRGHILASKETIAFGLLIFDFWRDSSSQEMNSLEDDDQFCQKARRLGRSIARSHQKMSALLIRSQEPSNQCEFISRQWQEYFEGSFTDTGAIDERAINALNILEEEGLVIDPGITEAGLRRLPKLTQ